MVPMGDESDYQGDEDDQERWYTIAMLTCPYYWNGRIEGAMCRNGCWEEPQCHTNGPFHFPPDWQVIRLNCYSIILNCAFWHLLAS